MAAVSPQSVAFALVFVFFFALPSASAQPYPSANQNITIKRLTNMISNYLAYSQYNAICNVIATDVYAQKDFATVKSDLVNTAMAQLTSAQYSAVLAKATTLIFTMGASKLTAAVNTLMTVMSNNLGPFYAQLCAFSKQNQGRGLKPAVVWKEQFRLVNSFLSGKRVNTIFTRVAANFAPADWTKFRNAFSTFFKFSRYGL
ncbi:hypothetical protein M3Y99_00301700 [Aphelenchoides fujianensis]|nr:hypothetical protein M3Y99_01563100 [Aphelenchoides fujianensis]KAI6241809.1 hypothetical protein M3Y99_00301700 [Aphelenchoides fujianensis]